MILVAVGLPLTTQGVVAQRGAPAPLDYESPLQGVVLEESSFQPIESATVTIVGANAATDTDSYGSFAFRSPPLGPVSVRVTAPGYVTLVEEVEIHADGIVSLQFLVPRLDAVLSDLFVPGTEPTTRGEPSTAADLVARRIRGLQFGPQDVGDLDRDILLRGISTFDGGSPHLFVDGVRVSGTSIYEVLSRIPAEDVERIEILRGANQAFRHSYAADGVIHVYTR